MNILVTGGAGYIGSHVVKHLIEDTSNEITILDNLSTGLQRTVDTLKSLSGKLKFINADLSDFGFVEKLFKSNSYEAVIHFAAAIVVPESVKEPLKYYLNNTVNTANLVDCASKNGVKKFIFSSTAAVYGEPACDVLGGIPETTLLAPINPYGRSKLFSEYIIKDAAYAVPDFKYVILRYFNVAGADKDGLIGQSSTNSTHLIKIASETAIGKRDKMYIFGDDYKTQDGTCIRDYIHVDDLASAHVAALGYLENGQSDVFNCGYGHGYSVKEVLDVMKKVTGVDFISEMAPRREGDPDMLISRIDKIREIVGWKSKYDNLEYICKTAFEWEQKLSKI